MNYRNKNNQLTIEANCPGDLEQGWYFSASSGEEFGDAVHIELSNLMFMPTADTLRELHEFREIQTSSVRMPVSKGHLTFLRKNRGDIELSYELKGHCVAASGTLVILGEDAQQFLQEFRSVLGEYGFSEY